MRKLILSLTALASLTMASAHARLGWTLEQCQAMWGEPTSYLGEQLGSSCYNFQASSNFYAQVNLINGIVHRVTYCSRSRDFLLDNAGQLLQKNLAGFWGKYDDGRGKATLMTWQFLDGNNTIAYAILNSYPDEKGFYKLQVCSHYWGTLLQEGSNPGTGLNI
jgi:hypothetical protein